MTTNRLRSLDFFRGAIMVLLMFESTGLYAGMLKAGNPLLTTIGTQFEHHSWAGLRFWDLIQPGFMFIAGTALAFSLNHQHAAGIPWGLSFRKALKRSGWLFFWGVLDYAVRPGGLSFELWDVLTQLSFTLLVAFLIFRWTPAAQIAASLVILMLAEALYRLSGVPGFDQPFVDQHNFGNYVDLLLMNKINPDGWVAINCLSTAAHTIWGAVAGRWLLSTTPESTKTRWLVVAGVAALIIGFSLDATTTPIIKRIATTSFVIASGGFCLLALAGCHWLIDVRGHRRGLQFFTIVSMNSLFIYLFIEIVGNRWFNGYVGALSNGLLGFVGVSLAPARLLTAVAIFALEWQLCAFLYRRQIFFKA